MTSIDYRAELAKAGANIDSRWARLRFLARRYPLGAVGAVIMAACVFAAVFAPYITIYDPLSTNAALSFLGLGVPEPYPSWGRMLSESAAEYVRTAPWLVIFPGLAISLIVFGTNLLGDALRDVLDPRQRS